MLPAMVNYKNLSRRAVLGLGVVVIARLAWGRRALATPLAPATEEALRSASLLYVATRRKSGERSSVRPIWFMYEDGAIYFTTSPGSWKARRIARGSPLYVWIGSQTGPYLVGQAERIQDRTVVAHMGERYAEKYWIAWFGLFRPDPDRVAGGKTIAYRVTVEEQAAPVKRP
jgi:general stress protein 26